MDTHISASEFNLEIGIMSKPIEDSAARAALGFNKIRTWLEIALNDTVMVHYDSIFVDALEEDVDNVLFKTPGEPDDVMVSILLLSKLRAIAGDHLTVFNLTVSSGDTGNMKRLVAGDLDGMLPGIEYLGEPAAYSEPWWERGTIETVDFTKVDREDEHFEEMVASDPMKEIEKIFLNKEADVISMDTWKPEK